MSEVIDASGGRISGAQISEKQVDVELSSLRFGLSPRSSEPSPQRVRLVAAMIDSCPPIIVERSSCSIVDGVHRVLAARTLGRKTIRARLFEGSHGDAIVVAIRANVVHGLPLTLAEREAGAQRILSIHPQWSDRRIGEVCGLSGKTVASLRNRPTAEVPQLDARVGADGRRRPADPEKQRAEIAKRLAENPTLSLRRVAQLVHASPSTVGSVKRQMGVEVIGDASSRKLARGAKCSDDDDEGPAAVVADLGRALVLREARDNSDCDEWLDRRSTDYDDWTASLAAIQPDTITVWAAYARAQAGRWTQAALFFESRLS
jgi:ParB-like chromosome segregation protein Spo0J